VTAVSSGPDRRQLPAAVRRAGAAVAAAALGALIAVGPPVVAAKAASGTGFDQITGAGLTNSAVVVPWTGGLLDNTNKAIGGSPADELASNADRSSHTGPLSFMYNDFKNLKVTVSQTQDITQQGVTVSWTGGVQTFVDANVPQTNYLQMMECYGDSAGGPDPTQCDYGSAGMLPGGILNAGIGQRAGPLCVPGAVASPNPDGSSGGGVPSADGSQAVVGCDPQEPGSNNRDLAPCPGIDCSPTQYDVSFVPAPNQDGTTNPAEWDPATESPNFNQFQTNEVQEALTQPGGVGKLQFETLTGPNAPGLGCGEPEASGQTRNCWLVIVPRGTYEPNGYKVFSGLQASSFNEGLYSSPLSASNWAIRIQEHLDYSPLTTFCPPSTQAREVAGTQLIQRAMDSWELALNKQASCSKVYDFTHTSESTDTINLCSPTDATAGLAFTTIPIGSEAARDGTALPCQLPKILYAPVAVTAVGLGFNINDGKGFITKPVNMTPSLFAKSVTQVYRDDLPDFYPSTGSNPSFPGPPWAQQAPFTLSQDPEFQKLNPGVPPCCGATESLAPLLTVDHTAQTQQIWQWVQTDPATAAWLDKGTKSAGNTVNADPDYEKLQPQLGKAPGIDSFPRAYAGKLDLKAGEGTNVGAGAKDETRDSLDLLPYVFDYNIAGSNILSAVNPTTGNWNSQAIAPDGSTGWWGQNAMLLGQIFIWGVSDTSDLAAYGLVDAALCDAAGTPSSCVTPSVASLTTALNSAKPDSAGLLQVNPAKPGKHGYPLTQVVYAAVDTHQSAAALKDYANLIAYAAGPGQTPGVAPGDLLPGYLPLTKTLKNQALAVVAQLRKLAGGSSSNPSHSPGTSSSPAASHPASGGGGGSVTPTPASSSPAEFTISQASPQLAAATTQKQVLGAIRWALLVVVIAGAACATSGAALRSARVPTWLKRMRT
jgi:hypothetical protein